MINLYLYVYKMEYEDINKQIAYHINDYQSLKNYCYANRFNKRICSSQVFWINLFNNQSLDLPAALPNNINDWFLEYYAITNTNKILNILNDDFGYYKSYIFKNIYQNMNYFITVINNCYIYNQYTNIQYYTINKVIDLEVKAYRQGFLTNKYELIITFDFKNMKNIKITDFITFVPITKEQITCFLYNILRD